MTQPPPQPKRILAVDDDPVIRELIAEYLGSAGIVVDQAASAAEALALFDRHYDLMTLDYRMPGMSGSKLHYILSRDFGHGMRVSEIIPQRLPPILVITGCAQDPEVQGLLEGENVVEIIEKPLTRVTLLAVVNNILQRSEARKANRTHVISRLGDRVIRK